MLFAPSNFADFRLSGVGNFSGSGAVGPRRFDVSGRGAVAAAPGAVQGLQSYTQDGFSTGMTVLYTGWINFHVLAVQYMYFLHKNSLIRLSWSLVWPLGV